MSEWHGQKRPDFRRWSCESIWNRIWDYSLPSTKKRKSTRQSTWVFKANKEKGASFLQPLMNEQNLQTAWFLCVLFFAYSGDKSCLSTNTGAKGQTSSPVPSSEAFWNSAARDSRKQSPNEKIYWHSTHSAAFGIKRVSNLCLYKTSHHKLQSENKSTAESYKPEHYQKKEKHIKKLIHSINYLPWVGRTPLGLQLRKGARCGESYLVLNFSCLPMRDSSKGLGEVAGGFLRTPHSSLSSAPCSLTQEQLSRKELERQPTDCFCPIRKTS